MATFRLEILTPDRRFFDDQIEMLIFTGSEGEIGVMAGPIPMAATIEAGPMRIKKDGEWKEVFASEGFLSIIDGTARVLVQTAEWPEEIDRRRAEEAIVRANARIAHQRSRSDFFRARAAIARAMARIKVLNDTDHH